MKFRNKKTGEIVEWDCVSINSSLVSAQNRKRLYWTNIPNVEQPEDKGILSRDILLNDFEKLSDNRIRYSINAKFRQDRPILIQDKLPCVTTSIANRTFVDTTTRDLKDFYSEKENIENYNGCVQIGEADLKGHDYIKRVYSVNGKSPTLITSGGGHHEPKINIDNKQWRKLTPLECERLQTVPDNFTLVPFGKRMMSNSQRYKMLGNGWTVDVIAHIFKNIKE